LRGHNLLLWILQIVFGLFFLYTGVVHFTLPEGLPDQISWMYDLSDPIHYVAGTAEILGGLGLILPGLTRVAPWVIPWAALGMVVVMVGGSIWHIGRDEFQNVATNVATALVMVYIAYGRWKLAPIRPR
jgi:putative oxidoreductase